MANIAVNRIQREFKDVCTSNEMTQCRIKVELIDNNFLHLRGTIGGPDGTPYEGGTYSLDIIIPEDYPFRPPKIKFVTKVWHPNVSSVTGAICLDILKDQWAAAMTLRTVLLSIQALLTLAEPDDPQDAVVAQQYRENYKIFVATASHWTSAYAGAPDNQIEYSQKVKQLSTMGFPENTCRVALSSNCWNIERATEAILHGKYN